MPASLGGGGGSPVSGVLASGTGGHTHTSYVRSALQTCLPEQRFDPVQLSLVPGSHPADGLEDGPPPQATTAVMPVAMIAITPMTRVRKSNPTGRE